MLYGLAPAGARSSRPRARGRLAADPAVAAVVRPPARTALAPQLDRCLAAQRASPLRPWQRLLPVVARRSARLHLRVFRLAERDARRGPAREARSRVPKSKAA